jgi:hypothetical protein
MACAAFPIRRFPSGPLQHRADRRFRYAGRALQTGLLVAGYPFFMRQRDDQWAFLTGIGSIIVARGTMRQEKTRREAKVSRRSDEGNKGTP